MLMFIQRNAVMSRQHIQGNLCKQLSTVKPLICLPRVTSCSCFGRQLSTTTTQIHQSGSFIFFGPGFSPSVPLKFTRFREYEVCVYMQRSLCLFSPSGRDTDMLSSCRWHTSAFRPSRSSGWILKSSCIRLKLQVGSGDKNAACLRWAD